MIVLPTIPPQHGRLEGGLRGLGCFEPYSSDLLLLQSLPRMHNWQFSLFVLPCLFFKKKLEKLLWKRSSVSRRYEPKDFKQLNVLWEMLKINNDFFLNRRPLHYYIVTFLSLDSPI